MSISFWSKILICVGFLGFRCLADAIPAVIVGDQLVSQPLGNHVKYLISEVEVTLDEVRAVLPDRWSAMEDDPASFGLESRTVWLSFGLVSDAIVPKSLVLEISYPVLDYVDVFLVKEGNFLRHERFGDRLPFPVRPINYANFALPFELHPDEKLEVYLRVKSDGAVLVPLMLWQREAFADHRQRTTLWQGLFYGGTLALLFYNLFLYLSVRNRSYLICSVALLSMGLLTASLNGVGFQYLWPHAPNINRYAIVLSACTFGFMGILFYLSMLPVRKLTPRIYRVAQCYIAMDVVMLILVFLMPYHLSLFIALIIGGTGSVLLFGNGFYLWVQGVRAARYWMAACSILLIGITLIILSRFEILPAYTLIEKALELSSFASMILFSFALADRINHERRQKLVAQQTLATELESLVKRRTNELESANQQLKILTERDGLTGLYNRRYFDDLFQKEFDQHIRDKSCLCIVMIDLDHFKSLNDTYGHQFGDQCLRTVAEILQNCIMRPRDFAARYGGGEFILLLPNTDASGGKNLAHRPTTLNDSESNLFSESFTYQC